MAKYDDLKKYLNLQQTSTLTLSYKQVEQIIRMKLPATAYSSMWWWKYVTSGYYPVQGKSPYNSNFEVIKVDLTNKEVTFKRIAVATTEEGIINEESESETKLY